MPSLWEKFKKSDFTQDYLAPAWDWATTPLADDRDFDNKFVDIAYDELLRPLTAPLGLAVSAAPAARAIKLLKKGMIDKAIPPIKQEVIPDAPSTGYTNKAKLLSGKVENPKPKTISKENLKSVAETLRDEVKQIVMTFGVPGTAINSHSLALATERLKGTPVKKLPKEAWDVGRMLYNPNRALEANKKLTGGFSPKQVREGLEEFIQKTAPSWGPTRKRNEVERLLDVYSEVNPAAKNSRFKDILELERKENFGGGGLKTSDILGGSSKGSVPERTILTSPIRMPLSYILKTNTKINVNPFHWQKEMFDTPTFGEEYLNTYLKRSSALDELDRIKGNPSLTRQEQLKQASKFATDTLGGYGIDSPTAFNHPIAKWALTAPDWTKTHFSRAANQLRSVGIDPVHPIQTLKGQHLGNLTDQKYSPWRRHMGYGAAGLGATAAANYALNEEMPTRAVDIFNIELPQDKKQAKRDVIAPFSTAMDLPKTGFDIYNAMTEQYAPETKGLDSMAQFWRHRFHPVFSTAMDTLRNSTWRGGRMMDSEAYSKPSTDMLGNTTFERPDIPLGEEFSRVGKNMANNMLPQAYDALANLYGGNESRSGKEQMSDMAKWAQLLELPIRSYTPRYSQVETPFDRRMERFENRFRRFER